MEKNNTTEIVNELVDAIKYKQVNKVIELNDTMEKEGIKEFVERQLNDADYGLYRFIVSQARGNNTVRENNTERENDITNSRGERQ